MSWLRAVTSPDCRFLTTLGPQVPTPPSFNFHSEQSSQAGSPITLAMPGKFTYKVQAPQHVHLDLRVKAVLVVTNSGNVLDGLLVASALQVISQLPASLSLSTSTMHMIACAADSVLTDMVFYISMYVKRRKKGCREEEEMK